MNQLALAARRILSIDVFRGMTIFTMVFVNELAGISDIPQWMKHYPAQVDGMTFVDLVFPAFLFIVGMSIPFATQARFSKGDSTQDVFKHVGLRRASRCWGFTCSCYCGRPTPATSLILFRCLWSARFTVLRMSTGCWRPCVARCWMSCVPWMNRSRHKASAFALLRNSPLITVKPQDSDCGRQFASVIVSLRSIQFRVVNGVLPPLIPPDR